MDWEYVKENGYAAWQVIPIFFSLYSGMLLVFGGSSHIVLHSYGHHGNLSDADHHIVGTRAWGMLISGICVLSLATVYSIVACIVIPLMKRRRKRAQRVHDVTEPDASTVEGLVQNWFASPQSDTDLQEQLEAQESSFTLRFYIQHL